MPAISSLAHAKLILFGEHAVVYGEPAIAIPFNAVEVRTLVEPLIKAPSGSIHIYFPQLEIDQYLDTLPNDNIIVRAIAELFSALYIEQSPTCKISVFSTIPLAAGLGASAALSVSVMKALSDFLGHPLDRHLLNQLAFKTETVMHGNPSGVDNSVVVYEKPVYYIKGSKIEFLRTKSQLTFLVADTGVKKSTAAVVAQVASDRLADPHFINKIFRLIGDCTLAGRLAFENADLKALGQLMNYNQELLTRIRLSSPELDNLILNAINAGAFGAKLTGGGKGGHMLALVDDATRDKVKSDLEQAGAQHVYITTVYPDRQ